MPQPLYAAVATADGDGREGHVRSDDGLLDAELNLPTSLGGKGDATNPEQLFAAGYAACFMSTLKNREAEHGVALKDASVTAEVSIGPQDDGGFGLSVQLHVELGGGVSQGDAEKAVDVAHRECPYSRATRGNIDVVIHVETA